MMKDPRRPMSQALRQRLRDIPRREVLCRDVDRLYRFARARARARQDPTGSSVRDGAAERHLDECSRCRELYATLTTAFEVRRLPLPQRLALNLRQVARQPERLLPIWIADTRYAAAACYLLAALTLSLAGDASALFRDTTQVVSSKAVNWVDRGETRGLEVWHATATTVRREVGDGWEEISRYGASTEKFLANVYQTLETRTLELIPGDVPVEGDSDARSGKDTERRTGHGVR